MLTFIFKFIYFYNKNIFISLFFVSYFELIYIVVLLLLNWLILTCNSYRHKLICFMFLIFWLSLAGYYLSFDGFVFLFLITELSLILLFLILFLSNSFEQELNKYSPIFMLISFFLGFFFFFFYQSLAKNNIYYIYDYIYLYVVDLFAKDLILLYMFVIYINFYIVVYISAILGLFSIFFICVFYSMKNFYNEKLHNKINNKILFMLRQQITTHQTNYRSKLKMFQK